MDQFVRSQNVERYRRLLERVTDESDRQQIINLLAEERHGEAPRTTAPVKAASCNASLSLYLQLVAWPSVATPTAKRSHHGMDNASSD